MTALHISIVVFAAINQMMTLKEEIIETLNALPESKLSDVLAYLRSLQEQDAMALDTIGWQVYLESEEERQDVYRQLADA